MDIIGISGKIGTGKTTLSGHLIKMLGEDWERIAFGDLLKQEVSDRFGIPLIWCYTGKNNIFCIPEHVDIYNKRIKTPSYPGPTIREIMQWWGAEVRRAHDPSYWVKKMAVTLRQADAAGRVGVIIDDVRFEDEALLVQDNGGFLARLDPFDGWQGCSASTHESETALDQYQYFDAILAPEYGALERAAGIMIQMARDTHGKVKKLG